MIYFQLYYSMSYHHHHCSIFHYVEAVVPTYIYLRRHLVLLNVVGLVYLLGLGLVLDRLLFLGF